MRISDWSSDVCSSDLGVPRAPALIERDLPLECADRGAEQRDFQRDRGAIDRQPRGEIVAAVADQASPRQQRLRIGAVPPPGNRGDRDMTPEERRGGKGRGDTVNTQWAPHT